MTVIHTTHIILYVADQARSTALYSTVLESEPRLFVPGMTEFDLPGGAVMGLMPAAGIKRLLGDALPDPSAGAGIPRVELYLVVDDPQTCLERAVSAGAGLLSPVLPRDWGHDAGYAIDPDGHVLAFARVR